jgi:hypothetical protein
MEAGFRFFKMGIGGMGWDGMSIAWIWNLPANDADLIVEDRYPCLCSSFFI